MAKKSRVAAQWKVVTGLHISELERTLELWTGRGWTVVSVLGPQGRVAIVFHRKLVL